MTQRTRICDRPEKRGERGITLMVGAVSLLFIIPAIGLAIDVGFMYASKAKIQASVDGAALAAARALVLGQTTQAQADSAKANAVTWFNANFPSGTFGTSNTMMSTNDVLVFDDPNNPLIRNVTVTARTKVSTFFMRWLGYTTVSVGASGNASRRDVVVMMVLDRSGSMGATCPQLLASAKLFVGKFANGRDRIGLISFADNAYLHSAPTQNFRTVLGYTDGTNSGSGEIDSIVCDGNTNMAQAVSLGYNELYKTNLPGALNILMFETDGLPNTLTLNFWDSSNNVAGIANSSPCTDSNGKTKNNSGFNNLASLPSWTGGKTMGPNGFISDIPAGIVGGVGYDDPTSTGVHVLFKAWTTSKSNNFNESGNNRFVTSNSAAPNCTFRSDSEHDTAADLAWAPTTDVYGNNLVTSYKSVTTIGSPAHVQMGATNFRKAAFNATDHSAYRARTNGTLPSYVFVIGLGGNSTNPVDYVLLQRMANDADADNFNTPAKYVSCASATSCVTFADQPQGTFIFSTDASVLSQAFLQISSQILRLSK